jgi:hypothetical protein
MGDSTVDKPMIGIRQADGSFYEIMDDAHGSRKRMVLSAARTDQHSVKIDLFRSTDGTMDAAVALGTIALEDPDGLGFQDIEFRVDLDSDGLLDASAALPGHPPRTLSVDLTPFRDEPVQRSDADILADDTLAAAELDDLGDAFNPEPELEPEPMTLDFPETDDFGDLEEPLGRSDADILADDLLAGDDLDTLDLDSPDLDQADPAEAADPDDSGLADLGGLDDFTVDGDQPAEAETFDDFSLDTGDELDDLDASPAAAESFDLTDLDAGFGDEPAGTAGATSGSEPSAGDPEQWEKISLDDMESMEFMDTGDEISRPKAKTKATEAPSPMDEFSMDDDQPLELGDLDSDLGDLPDLGDLGDLDSSPRSSDRSTPVSDSFDGLDQDFLGLEDLDGVAPEPAKAKTKPPKAAPEKRAPKGTKPVNDDEAAGGLDKTALLLSLSALSLLVLLILVLLFLNMIKAPTPPVIQPEVMGWKPATSLAAPGPTRTLADLGSADAPSFEAASVLEVPEALRGARISMTLGAGDTVADAQRRFGPPAKVEGAVLSW